MNPLLCEKTFEWSDGEERRKRVLELHEGGDEVSRIAKKLGVCRRTIIRDCDKLGLETFSSLSDVDLEAEVLDIIQTLSSSIGLRAVEGALIHRGLRVQERCITSALVNYLHYTVQTQPSQIHFSK